MHPQQRTLCRADGEHKQVVVLRFRNRHLRSAQSRDDSGQFIAMTDDYHHSALTPTNCLDELVGVISRNNRRLYMNAFRQWRGGLALRLDA